MKILSNNYTKNNILNKYEKGTTKIYKKAMTIENLEINIQKLEIICKYELHVISEREEYPEEVWTNFERKKKEKVENNCQSTSRALSATLSLKEDFWWTSEVKDSSYQLHIRDFAQTLNSHATTVHSPSGSTTKLDFLFPLM